MTSCHIKYLEVMDFYETLYEHCAAERLIRLIFQNFFVRRVLSMFVITRQLVFSLK
jgi:hypothetical protein